LENITSILQDVDIIMDEHGDRCVTYSRTWPSSGDAL